MIGAHNLCLSLLRVCAFWENINVQRQFHFAELLAMNGPSEAS